MPHPLFERRTSVNEQMCMLFRSYMYACTEYFSAASRHVFLPSCDIFETFCILYRSLFHFPLRLSPRFSKTHIYWNDLAIMFTSGIIIGVLTRLQDTEKSRFVSANREVKRQRSFFTVCVENIVFFTLSYRIFSHKGYGNEIQLAINAADQTFLPCTKSSLTSLPPCRRRLIPGLTLFNRWRNP